MLYDGSSGLSPASTLVPQVATGAVTGVSIDLSGFESATVVINLGTFGGTTPGANIRIQESDDGSVWGNVGPEDLIGGALPAFDTSNDAAVIRRGYSGSKQFLRVTIPSVSGTSPTIPISALVLRGDARTQPVT